MKIVAIQSTRLSLLYWRTTFLSYEAEVTEPKYKSFTTAGSSPGVSLSFFFMSEIFTASTLKFYITFISQLLVFYCIFSLPFHVFAHTRLSHVLRIPQRQNGTRVFWRVRRCPADLP